MQNLILRPYQRADIDVLVSKRRVYNTNEPGLGKTIETLTALKELNFTGCLILCPKIATGVWQEEAMKWYGWKSIILGGTLKQRKLQIQEFLSTDTAILITNFALLKEISVISSQWNSIIVDELHLGGMLNRNSQKYKELEKLKSTNMFLLTGTPVRRGPQDLYAPLHLLYPKLFKSYWGFVNKWCHVIEGPFGKEIMGRPKDPVALKTMLNDYMVRHLKRDVLDDLPEKQLEAFPIEMSPTVAKMYQELLKEMLLITDDTVIVTQNRMVQDLRLRQLLVCPRMLGIPENGAAIDALVDYLIPEEFDAGNDAIIICTPFRKAIPFIIDAILEKLPETMIYQIHGEIKNNANDVAHYFQEDTRKRVLIYTIKSGASWTAHAARDGFFIGYEYSTNDNDQAIDRIHRIGQHDKVRIRFLLHKGTIDEHVMDILNTKRDAANWILKPEEMRVKLEALQERYKHKEV